MRRFLSACGALHLRRALFLAARQACLWALLMLPVLPAVYGAEAQQEARGGALFGAGLGVAAFTRDFAKEQAPGPEAEAFFGYRFVDPYARSESFALGLNTRYSVHAGLKGHCAAHRLIVAWEGAIGFPLAAGVELGLGMQVGVVYLSQVYGAGYDQGFFAFSRWQLPAGTAIDLTLKADITDKKLFIKSAGLRSRAAFTEATLALGLRVFFGSGIKASR